MGYDGKRLAIHYGTADAYLDSGPGVVYWVNLVITTGDGTFRVRDGSDVGGEILVTLKQDAGQPGIHRFDPPLPYDRGLFADVVDHIQDYTIAYDHQE